VVSAAFLLANTMRTLVAEQSREIGVMRSVGASRRDLRDAYLRTAALLGLFGAVIGAALGIGLAYLLVGEFARLIFGISPGFAVDWPVVLLSALAGVVGAVLTAWPTLRRVLRTPVSEALAGDGMTSAFGGSRLDRAVLHSVVLPTPVRIGVRNVARQKGRSATTIVQVALAVATLLGLLSLALAVSEVTDQSWNVLAYDITLSAQPGGRLYTPAVVADVRAQPGVAGVEPADWTQLTYRGQTLFAIGVHARSFVHETITAGRWLTPDDERADSRVAIIGSAAARRWHLHPGSRVSLTTPGGAATFTVVGVGGSDADNGYNVYTSLAALQAVTGHAQLANSMLVRSTDKSHDRINAVAARLEDRLAHAGYASRSQIMYAGRATEKAQSRTMLLIVESIGLLIVLISMLGLVNAITMNIIERTREIGVLRCLGAQGRDLRRIFRTETTALALLGFLLAIPLGWMVAHALQWLILHVVGAQLPAPYTLGNLGLALIGTVVLAVLVVSLPLRHATRLRPGDAVRYN
jgi:putative ABC transport system permease protein